MWVINTNLTYTYHHLCVCGRACFMILNEPMLIQPRQHHYRRSPMSCVHLTRQTLHWPRQLPCVDTRQRGHERYLHGSHTLPCVPVHEAWQCVSRVSLVDTRHNKVSWWPGTCVVGLTFTVVGHAQSIP
jgi:hypothetical protein